MCWRTLAELTDSTIKQYVAVTILRFASGLHGYKCICVFLLWASS